MEVLLEDITWKIKGFKEFHPTYPLGTNQVFPDQRRSWSRWMLEIKPNTIKTSIYVDESVKVLCIARIQERSKLRLKLHLQTVWDKRIVRATRLISMENFNWSLSKYWKHIKWLWERISTKWRFECCLYFNNFRSSTTTLQLREWWRWQETQTEVIPILHSSYKTMSWKL